MGGPTLRKSLFSLAVLSILPFAMRAQIEGPSLMTVGEPDQYYYGVAPGGEWWIYPGGLGSTSNDMVEIVSATEEIALLRPKRAGTFWLYYRLNGTDHELAVTVLNGPPSAPPRPVIGTEQCDLTVLEWSPVASPPSGVNWWWQDTHNGQSRGFGQGSSINITPSITARTWYLQSENASTGTWGETSDGITVDVAISPDAPSSNSFSRCGQGQVSLSTTAGSDATGVNWYTSANAGTSLSSNLVTVNSSTTYYAASVSAAGCESATRSSVSVTILAMPVPGILSRLSPSEICVGSNFNVEVMDGSGMPLYEADYYDQATGNWVNVLSDHSGSENFSYQARHEGNWRVRVRSGAMCGPSAWSEGYVTFDVWPVPGDPSNKNYAPSTVCAGQGVVQLSATPTDGNLVRWYETATSLSPIAPTSNPNVVRVGPLWETRQYLVSSVRTGGCEGERYPITIVVHPTPTEPLTNHLNRCGPGQVTLTTTPGEGADGLRWYESPENGLALSSNVVMVNSSTTYYTSSLTTAGCEGKQRAPVSVTILPVPVPGILSRLSSSQLCVGSYFNVEVTGGSGVPLYEADYYDQSIDKWVNVLSDHSASENFSYQAQYAGNWRVRVRSGATCGPSVWSDDYITFDVWPNPGVPTITTTSALCAGGQKLLSATLGEAATGVKWYNVPQNGLAINSFPYQTDVTTLALYNDIQYWASSYAQNGDCESERVSILLDVTPLPVDSDIVAVDDVICLGDAVELSTSGGLGIEFWFASNDGGLSWKVLSDVEGGTAGSGFVHLPEQPGLFRYRVRNDNGCGYCGTPGTQCSYYKYVDVNVVGEARPGHIFGESFVEPRAVGTYTLNGHSYAESFNWTISNGQITSGQGSPQVTVKFDGAAVLSVEVSNSTCANGEETSAEIRSGFNYVIEEVLLIDSISNPIDVVTLNESQKTKVTTYYDGLGRSMQTVAWRNSPGHRDFVQPLIYDQYGRESLKFLPFAAGTDGEYKPNEHIINLDGSYTGIAQPFYSTGASGVAVDPKPSAGTVFDNSPLNRVVEQGAPGVSWQVGSGNTITKTYQFNGPAEVLHFVFENDQLSLSDDARYYDSNTLYKNITFDEHDNDVQEFINKEGQLICKKVRASDTEYVSTYYVFDKKGQLVLVIPPEGTEQLSVISKQ